MRFCPERESVIAVLSGMSTLGKVLDNTRTSDEAAPLTDEEREALGEAMRIYRETQMSGCLMEYGMSFGNVRETPLKDLLSGGAYVDVASMTAGDLREGGGKCGACPYFEFCGGGCRALGVLFTGERDSFLHEDRSKCIFFENGWYQKVVQALPGWTNLSEIPVG